MVQNFKVVIGDKYGSLTPICVASENRNGEPILKCRCDCGNEIYVSARDLIMGKRMSCGRNHKICDSNTKEYRRWASAKQRCYNTNFKHYYNYGGRGIKMCDRWLHSFSNFIADMGPLPSAEYTLDRIDPNGDYCPENCRWANRVEQGNNRRNNHTIEYKGERLTITEFSRKYGVKFENLRYALRMGYNIEDIINRTKHQRYKKL